MPQRAALPVLTTFQREASKALTALSKEITQREQELSLRKAQAARWQSMLHESPRPDGAAAPQPSRRRRVRRARLDWSAIFTKLPGRFTSKDLAQQSGKPRSKREEFSLGLYERDSVVCYKLCRLEMECGLQLSNSWDIARGVRLHSQSLIKLF